MQELDNMINSKISHIKMGMKLHENKKSAIRELIFRNKDKFSWNYYII